VDVEHGDVVAALLGDVETLVRGVEREPGRKDPDKLEAFAEAVRATAAAGAASR